MDGATAESRPAVEQTPPPQGAGNQTRATPQSNLVDEAVRVAASLNDKLPTLSQEPRLPGASRSGTTEAARETQAHEETAAFAANASVSPAHAESTAESAQESATDEAAAAATPAQTDTRGGRMRQRAASVGENLRPRVEKLREASTVVLDEASDDPGLRFVIIAALLFLLFLFILLFSYILA